MMGGATTETRPGEAARRLGGGGAARGEGERGVGRQRCLIISNRKFMPFNAIM